MAARTCDRLQFYLLSTIVGLFSALHYHNKIFRLSSIAFRMATRVQRPLRLRFCWPFLICSFLKRTTHSAHSVRLGGLTDVKYFFRLTTIIFPSALPQESPRWFVFWEKERQGGGKVGNLVLVFHFSIRLRRRPVRNVEIAERFPRTVESRGMLSISPSFPQGSLVWRMCLPFCELW